MVAVKTAKMSGQAHVVFRDIQTASQAMRALHNFEFFGKEMVSSSLGYELWVLANGSIEDDICEDKV